MTKELKQKRREGAETRDEAGASARKDSRPVLAQGFIFRDTGPGNGHQEYLDQGCRRYNELTRLFITEFGGKHGAELDNLEESDRLSRGVGGFSCGGGNKD